MRFIPVQMKWFIVISRILEECLFISLVQILCKLLFNILYLKATTYEMREVTSGKLLSQHPCKNEQYIYSKNTILFHEFYYQLY